MRLLAVRSPAATAPARYLIRHTTREVKARLAGIDHRLDINTLERAPAEQLAMNDIASVTFKLAQPLFADPYADNRATGAFIVIDEATNNTVGAGMIRRIATRRSGPSLLFSTGVRYKAHMNIARPALMLLLGVALTAQADYVDVSIMLSHDRCRAPTTHLERQAPILSST